MNAHSRANESVTETTSLEELLHDLADPDRDVRQKTALAVGERADAAATEALLAQLWSEPDFFVRDTLTWAVTRVGSTAVAQVRQALTADRDPAVRTQALHVLSKIADPGTVDDIVPLVDDPDGGVAAKARWALSRIGDPRAIPVLADRLGQSDAEAQNALTDVLASFGPEAVPVLVEALADDESAVRRHAADVLGYVGHPHAEAAAGALGAVAADADSDVAVSALMALGTLTGDDAGRAIADATGSPDAKVRAVAERLAGRAPKVSRLEAARAARAARIAQQAESN